MKKQAEPTGIFSQKTLRQMSKAELSQWIEKAAALTDHGLTLKEVTSEQKRRGQ